MQVGCRIGLECEVNRIVELACAAGQSLGKIAGSLERGQRDIGRAKETLEEIGQGGYLPLGGQTEAISGIGQAGRSDAVTLVPKLEVEVIGEEEVIEVSAIVIVLDLGVAGEFLELGIDGLGLDITARGVTIIQDEIGATLDPSGSALVDEIEKIVAMKAFDDILHQLVQ